MEYVDLSQELADGRVYVTDNQEELFKKLQAEFLSGDRIEFLFLNSYAALCQDTLLNLTGKVVEICESKSMDQNTIFNQCKFWTKNTILNMPYFVESRPLGFLEDLFAKKTALIVSAGPSLNYHIQKIKENRDKFIVIAVAPTLRLLIEAGITPDFATFADSNHMIWHIKGIEDKLADVNLVINTRTENCIIDAKFGLKILYFSETDSLSHWVKDRTSENVGLYRSGGTISILSYYLAKSLGCDPIAFVGLDLAFIDNQVNALNSPYQQNADGTLYVTGLIKKTALVNGYNGQTLQSRDDYALFIRQFNEIFTQEHNPARVINTATSGALIEGVEYMEFDELVKMLNVQNVDVTKALLSQFGQTKEKWQQLNSNVYQELRCQKEKISEMTKK